MLILVWFIACAVFVGSAGGYYTYTKKMSEKPWNVKINDKYQPKVAVLVPVHNEEKAIQLKLRNLGRIVYPSDKFEIILANDASTDRTLEEVEAFQANNKLLKIRVLDSHQHVGKAGCLNLALKSNIDADVIVMSDADCFWPTDILTKAIPFLSDPEVGAVCARELILNPQGSWVTQGEQFFDSTVESIRIGESKVYSTIIFHGGFAVFKRAVLDQFDEFVDDSGTALSIIQKNRRALQLSETGFFTTFPTLWKNKVIIKIRRAIQLQHLWAKCFKLMLKGKLRIPMRIALPEIFLHIFNPIFLLIVVVITTVGIAQYPLFFGGFLMIVFSTLLTKKTRAVLFEVLQNNFILLASLSSFFTRKGFKLWKSVQESRSLITEVALKNNDLI